MLLTHIFDAQFEFLALAERSDNRDAIEALVDRFLQPTSLPTIQLAQGSRGGEVIEPQNKGLDVPRFYLI
ncbi:hypothetical protein GGS21DRAFT_533478 [Xylaria nigripes]|nr:hypothetical protein GGS21DRAFT_533478 [Xylaria nigripes]